jgi:hypothetical protein
MAHFERSGTLALPVMNGYGNLVCAITGAGPATQTEMTAEVATDRKKLWRLTNVIPVLF